MAKRKARKFLKATALAAGTMLAGCGSQANEDYVEPPGNPKGSGYDDQVVQTDMTQNENLETETETPDPDPDQPDPVQPDPNADSEDTPPDPDMQPEPGPPDPLPLPANPKGSMYDDGMFEPPSE